MSEAAARVFTQDKGDEERLLLTVAEAANRLRIGRSLMYELLAAGDIPSIRIGRLRRVPCEALQDFVARGHGTKADMRL